MTAVSCLHGFGTESDAEHDAATARRAPFPGFTLVELLVVIGIIGVLVSLLMPAIQAARESSRRTKCQSNVKQNLLALHSYHDTKGALPPGGVQHQKSGQTGLSWRVLVLPFLEEQDLYSSISPDSDGGADNWDPEKVLPEVFACPSADPDTDTWKRSNYYGVGGAARDEHRVDLEDDACGDLSQSGVFYPNSHTRFKDVTDGSAHTLAIGEQTYLFRSWMTGSTWYGSPGTMFCGEASNNVSYPINADHDRFGYFVSDGRAPPGGPYSIVLNDLFFGSHHPGGAYFGLMDGSVQFLSDEIDFTVYEAHSTVSGGEDGVPLF